LAALCGLAMTAAAVTPANAATPSATMLVKGVGSTFSHAESSFQSARAGSAVTYTVRVVNNGPSTSQFRVQLYQPSATFGFATLYDGSTAVPPNDEFPNDTDYITPPLAPDAAKNVTVRISSLQTTPQTVDYAEVRLYAPGAEFPLDVHFLAFNIAAPSRGTTSYDMFVRNGGQLAVGGSVSDEVMSSAPVRAGGASSYSIRLQNDGTTATRIGLLVDGPYCPGVTVSFRSGLTDVTNAVRAGTFRTSLVPPGGHRTLTATMKDVAAPGCTEAAAHVVSTDPDGAAQVGVYLWLPFVASS
jgi:hypothetical protein